MEIGRSRLDVCTAIHLEPIVNYLVRRNDEMSVTSTRPSQSWELLSIMPIDTHRRPQTKSLLP